MCGRDRNRHTAHPYSCNKAIMSEASPSDPLLRSESNIRQATIIISNDRSVQLPKQIPSPFVLNRIATCKYNCVTFLPKNLWEQFHKLANVYFLAIAVLQCLPNITVSGGVPNILLPLLFVLLISGVKDILEDLKRRKSDKEENNRKVLVREECTWIPKHWRELVVGDIVKVQKNEFFPADLVLIRSSESKGICYVETKNLDGETNLKHKIADKYLLKRLISEDAVDRLNVQIKCQVPNNMIYEFSGLLFLEDQTFALTYEQLLLRGSSLRNTDWVVGLVVYTGHETKIMLNSTKSRGKFSQLEDKMNREIVHIFLLQVFICFICAICYIVWFFLRENETDEYLALDSFESDLAAQFVIMFFSWMLIFTNFVPISLIVTLEMVKFLQAIFISWDLNLYYEPTDTPAAVQSSNLNEELGQVNYLFSDKTGTLTCNVMEFRKISLQGEAFGTDARTDAKDKISNVDFVDPTFEARKSNPEVQEFLLMLASCHTVIADKEESGALEYKASSPDELALVNGARAFGVVFLGRDQDQSIEIDMSGRTILLKLLNVLEFTSDRKRMSVIVEYPNGLIRLLCKGADSIIFPRVKQSQILAPTMNHLEDFATEGLRTLVYAYKDFSKEEYDLWNRKYTAAMNDILTREKSLADVAELAETNLTLIGATAIEDKLQDGVPETIQALKAAGLKIWVLTGDKVETAVNIGYSCSLLHNEMMKITIDGQRTELVREQIAQGLVDITREPRAGFALIITGDALLRAINANLQAEFLRLTSHCDVVMACRVSPRQKADIVCLMITSDPQIRALSIGDGANDVNMITVAHVGVGISGLEGQQAVRASDYAISQFKYLRRLLFVHGRESYRRNCTLICYNFYKNVLLVLPLFWLGFISAFSGQILYNMWTYQLFNVIFASLPICVYALFDKEYEPAELESNPKHFLLGAHNKLFTSAVFWSWIVEAIVLGLCVVLLPLYSICYYAGDESGRVDNMWVASTCVLGLIVILANLKVVEFSNTHYWFSLLIIAGSIVVYFLTTAVVVEWLPVQEWLDNFESYGSLRRMWQNPNVYSSSVLCLAITFLGLAVFRQFCTLITMLRTSKRMNDTAQELREGHDSDFLREPSSFSRKRKFHLDTGFAFSQEAGQTPQITDPSFYASSSPTIS